MRSSFKLILILVILFCASAFSSFYLYSNLYPPEDVNKSTFRSVVLGETEYGNVIRDGPYGNVSSPNRIVYIVGVHPLEYQAHNTIMQSVISQNNSLKNCYYIYRVNVTQNADNYEKGRSNGQSLANKYAVPDIKNMSIDLVIDVHSNEGNYQKKWFIFIPKKSQKAEIAAYKIKNQTNWLTIYSPPNPTSPSYVTIPLIESGIPSMIYETYTYESYQQSKAHSLEIVQLVDQLKLS